MSGQNWNDMSVEELEKLHEEKNYQFLICDGRILWVYED